MSMMEKIDTFFKLTERKTSLKTEFLAATATFMTLCYILAVNSRLLSESGGYCKCSEATAADPACVFYDGEYALCQEDFRRQLITGTALSSFIACLGMGFGANLPFALAPGMGLNAYFTYDVVGFKGTGKVKWETAMAAIFLEGIVFIILAVTGLRTKLAKLIPKAVQIATTGGIGLFLAHLGLQTAEGIGLVVTDIATGVTLGGCAPDHRTYAVYDGLTADAYTCDNLGGKMESATTWIGMITVILIALLLKRKVVGAVVIGMAFCTIISWFRNSKVSYFEDDVYPLAGGMEMMGGEYRWNYFKKVAHVETMDDIWFKWDFGDFGGSELAIAFFTFLYVDLFDTTGTLYAMAEFAGLLDENGDFPGQLAAFCVDGAATSFGSIMGMSPVTTYIESAPGIEAGGRTGLTAIIVGLYFLLSIFFAPLLASVPPWATGPALIIVGAMMMRGLTKIEWTNYGEAVPAFLTIALMPLTYSIAYGIIGGIVSYILINGGDWLINKAMEMMGMGGAKAEAAPAEEKGAENAA